MDRIIIFNLRVLLALSVVMAVLQFDVVKRKLASYNHRVSVPNYVTGIDVNGIEMGVWMDHMETKGVIPVDRIFDFYEQVNGEQVIVDGQPAGGVGALREHYLIAYSIVFRNRCGDLHSINVRLAEDESRYFIHIVSDYN